MGIIPDGISLSYEDLTNLHPKGNNVKVEIGDQAKTLLREYSTHQAVIEQAEAKVSEIKARLCELLGDAEYGTIDNEVVATWKTATRTSFDSKKFEAEHPALAAKYKKQSTYRTFRVVNNEGDKQ
jgi:predicted phage-related endonuclease